MIQNLVAFASLKNEVNRLLTDELVKQLSIEVIASIASFCALFSEKLFQVLEIITIFLRFRLIDLFNQFPENVDIIFVDRGIGLIFDIGEKFSDKKGRMIGASAILGLFMYDSPFFYFEPALCLHLWLGRFFLSKRLALVGKLLKTVLGEDCEGVLASFHASSRIKINLYLKI